MGGGLLSINIVPDFVYFKHALFYSDEIKRKITVHKQFPFLSLKNVTRQQIKDEFLNKHRSVHFSSVLFA